MHVYDMGLIIHVKNYPLQPTT